MKKSPYLIAVLLTGLLSATHPLSASTRIWSSAADGPFSGAGNLWGTAVPGTGDVASFSGGYAAGSSFTVTLNGNVTNQYLRTDGDNPFTVTLNLAGHNYTATDSGGATSNSTAIARTNSANNTLNIVGGGTFSSNGFFIAGAAATTGKVAVSGLGTALSVNTNETVVGFGGDGTLEITNKAMLTTSAITRIGRSSGSVGTLLINDATWTANHEAQFGAFNAGSTGHLTVENGGKISVTSTGQNGWLSFGALGSANALITGGGSEVSAKSTIAIGGRGNTAGGTAEVTVQNGGKLITTSTLNLFGAGTLLVDGGVVSAASLGTSTELASGTISLTLSGVDAMISVSGGIHLDGTKAVLNLDLKSGASYSVNDTIHLLDYGTLSGTFSNYTEGEEFVLGDYQFRFSYEMLDGADKFIGLTVIPEPSAVALIGVFGMLVFVRRKGLRA